MAIRFFGVTSCYTIREIRMETTSVRVIPWFINTPSSTPTVIRYLNEEHVDAFFETGELQLSSFAQFAKHQDEQRGDRSEGINIINCSTADGKTLFAVTRHGADCYVLCGSTVESEELKRQFGYNSYFRILDTTRFGIAVGAVMANLRAGIEGPCIYQDQRVIRRQSAPISETLGDLSKKGEPIEMYRMFNYVNNAVGLDVLFVKLGSFGYQSEYRFAWATNVNVDGAIKVYVPNARQFCDRPKPKRQHPR